MLLHIIIVINFDIRVRRMIAIGYVLRLLPLKRFFKETVHKGCMWEYSIKQILRHIGIDGSLLMKIAM